ncbi:MAG: DUF5666 domain-containing protein [Myxococcales bacterium]
MFRRAAVSVVLLALVGCGAKSASIPGAVLEGTVQGATALTVSVPGTPLSTRTDIGGHFSLLSVPPGSSALRFTGAGVDATLAIAAMSSREHRSISVTVSGHDATEHHEASEAELRGTIDSIAAPSFVMAGKTVVTTTTGTVFHQGGATIGFADLNAGDSVEVEGALQADGSLLARSVSVEAPEAEDGGASGSAAGSDDVTFEGALAAASGSTLTVGTTTVQVDASTRIEKDDQAVAASALAMGDELRVEGALQSDGSVLAKEIKVLSAEQAAQVMVSGAVASVSSADGTFTIGTTSIKVDAHTAFSGQGSFASLADIAAGDLLDVEAAQQPDGSLLAIKVERLDEPELNEVEVKGAIEQLLASSLQVQGRMFAVDSSTQIESSGDALQLSSLKVGQLVDVRGTAAADGSLHATRISLESGN